MEENDRKPEIRFSGFETSWKKKCFGDEFDILSNNTLSRDCLNYNQGIAKNVHYGDVLIKFNEYLDASKEVLPYIEDEKVIDKFQNSFLRDGDIVIADTAEDETVGKCTEIGQIRDLPIIAGLHTMPCRPKSKYAPMYLGYYLNANAYHRELLPLMQGVKVKSISRSGVKDTDIIVSEEYDEQKKIGQYLFALDEKIKFEKDKLDRLIILKKSMLVKMFPQGNSKVPEIRFGKYTDDWEQRKLGEVGEFTSNGVDKLISPDEPTVNLLNYMDVYNRRKITSQNYTELMQVTAKPIQLKNNNILAGDVFFTPTSETADDIGHTLVIEENLLNTVYSYHLMRFRPYDGVFYITYPNYGFDTRELHDQMSIKAKGVQRFVISKPDFENLEITYPIYKEQENIAKFLGNLDRLITLHQRKVDKLKNIKSSCMDKMFV